MYIINDKVMNDLLGSDYKDIILFQKKNSISINKLYNIFKYKYRYTTYNGFRKFYNSKLKYNIDDILYIDNNNIKRKIIKWIITLLLKIY